MRRLLIVLVATAAFVAALGSSSSGAIVCPLAHGAAAMCCGPPVAQPDPTQPPCCAASATPCCAASATLCCPPNALCAVPLTILATPNPSLTGRPVTISGRLLSGQAATDIALWEELPREAQFRSIAHVGTDAMGNYTFTQTPATDRKWYVTAGSQQSTTIGQSVSAVIKVAARRRADGRAVLRGHVAPSHAGERVILERRLVSGTWKLLARVRLGRFSNYRTTQRVPRGMVELRAVLPADGRNAESISPIVKI